MADSPVAVDDGKASISAVAAKLFRDGAQWSKMGGEDAINSNDSFMPSKWYQIEGLIKRNSNLTKKI